MEGHFVFSLSTKGERSSTKLDFAGGREARDELHVTLYSARAQDDPQETERN